MFSYYKDRLKNRIKNTPFLYPMIKWFYIHLYRSNNPRLYARYHFIKKLKVLSTFVCDNNMRGGIINEKGEFFLAMDDGLYLFYNFQYSNYTIGDGQALDFKSGQEINELENFILNNLEPDAVYIDVGANNGYYYSLKVAKAYPRARVYAFEPDIKILMHLEKNIEFNNLDNIIVVKQALSDYVGQGNITADLEANNYLVVDAKSAYRTRTIDCNTLDDFTAENGLIKISFIKVDIEGGENRFLKGGLKAISQFRPFMVLEINEKLLNRSKSESEEVFSFMAELEYKRYHIKGSFDFIFIPVEKLIKLDLNNFDWLEEI